MRAKKQAHASISSAKAIGTALLVFALFASLFGGALFADEAPAQPTTSDETGFRSGVKVYVIPIRAEITEKTALFVKRSIAIARDYRAEYVILHIDTPGGLVEAMEEIGKDIAQLEDDGIKTVAFIDTDAASAGSYISMSCNSIVMADGGQIGSAALIFSDAMGNIIELSPEIREKMVSHTRAAFRAMAERNRHDPNLAEGMVDQRIWLFWATIEDKDGKQTTRVVTKEEKDKIDAAAKEAVESKIKPQQRIVEDKTIVDDTQLINFTAKQAVEYGLADATVKGGLKSLYRYLKLSDPEAEIAEDTIEEGLFAVLNSPLLRMLLIILGIGGIFLEIKTPGFGVPGIVGGASILLLILISSVVGTANIWEVILIFAGIVLLALEIFVIPGFGVAGIAGILCIVVGILLSMLPFTIPQTDWAWDYLIVRVRDMILGFAGAIALILILIRFLPSTPGFRRITLATAAGVEEGFIATNIGQKALLGQTGTAITTLRPVGKAEFGGEQYQVVADGDFVDAGCRVEVISVNGNSLTVRKVN